MASSMPETRTTAIACRYTLDGGKDVEQLIEGHQQLIANEVQTLISKDHLSALIMIGGYARGEGGYRYRQGRPEPYNDYDYFVVVRGVSRKVARRLQGQLSSLAEALEKSVGVEVDLAILRQETLPGSPSTLMFAEMVQGHRILAGDPNVLSLLRPMPLDELSLGEFTRLMLNRGALLLINQQMLATEQPLSAVAREQFLKYAFKAVLASGDAYLATRGLYHPLYQTKWQRLKAIEEELPTGFVTLYADAMEAKFHPEYERYALLDLNAYQKYIIRTWRDALVALEEARLGRRVQDWVAYASPSVAKGQSNDGVRSLLRNLAITLRDYGPREILANLAWSRRYPRERLISVLPVILGEHKAVDQPMVRQALAMMTGDPAAVEHAFLSQWHRYA